MTLEEDFLAKLQELDDLARHRFVADPAKEGTDGGHYVELIHSIRFILDLAAAGGGVEPTGYISSFLRDSGGSEDMTGNYSVTPGAFFFRPDPARNAELSRLIVAIEDTNTSRPQDYGSITDGLTNGLTLKIFDDTNTEIADLLDGRPIQTQGDWSRFCYDVNNLGSSATGRDLFTVRWTFARAGKPIGFPIGSTYRIEMGFTDNLSTLVSHTALIQGIYTT